MIREDLPSGVVTLVFTDIEGSTQLLRELGDRYAEVLADQRSLLRSTFAASAGVEVDTQGDAFFFAFPEAGRALVAVANAQRALAAHAWPDNRELRVRMGVHTGEPLRTPDGYVGLALHQGARVMACAHGQQIVVTAATVSAAQLEEGLALRDLGEHRLKDLSEPRRLFQLCGDGLRTSFPPLRTLGGYFTNLPMQPTPLLGRERELDELAELLAAQRLVTLTGPGGTGKTRLALQAGAEALDGYPGGVFFCDLAPLRDPDLVASTIARALGLREQPGETSEQTIAAYVAEKRLLLVLDNFEQLLRAAPLVARLLAACPNLRAIATSRAPLHLSGEREFPLESLALPDAVELFQERASLLGQNALRQTLVRDTVEAICERLDRLPLALELAAARLRSLSPEQLVARLEQRLSLLTGGARDAPHRQRTLRATLDWSYELLSPAQQRVLAGLGVFVGGCTLEAAEQVVGADLDSLDSLVEHSLVRHRDDRYTMLETVREYALDQLERAGDLDAARMRHADWVLQLLAQADPRDGRPFRPASMDELGQFEIDNLRQALPILIERRPDEIAACVLAVGWAWDCAEQPREGVAVLEAISASQALRPLGVIARMHACLAFCRVRVGDADAALDDALTGIDAAERSHDDWALIIALAARAYVAGDLDHPDPPKWARQALEIARRRGDPNAIAWSLSALASVLFSIHPEEAARCFEERLKLDREHNPSGAGFTVYHLALIALGDGRQDDAARLAIDQLHTGLREPLVTALVLRILGFALAGRRAHHDAARLIAASDVTLEHNWRPEFETDTEERCAALARIEAAIGARDTNEALRQGRLMQVDEALTLARTLTSPDHEPDESKRSPSSAGCHRGHAGAVPLRPK